MSGSSKSKECKLVRRHIFCLIVLLITIPLFILSDLLRSRPAVGFTQPRNTFNTPQNFCLNFNGLVNSSLYLNYTSGNLTFNMYTQANLTHHPGRYHFAVSSAPKNFDTRKAIRGTWQKMFNASSCAEFASFLFYVGRPADPQTEHLLQAELAEHPDDMVLIDFCDAYENLPLKTFNMMRFALNNLPNSRFVIKMDDDVYPNIPLLLRCFVRTVEDNIFGIYGIVSTDEKPHLSGKYQIAQSRFNGSQFPPFAHGPAYMVRRTDLPLLLRIAVDTPVLNLEDVWFVGIVASLAGVKLKNVERFLRLDVRAGEFAGNVPKALDRAFFFHHVTDAMLRKIWEKSPQTCETLSDHSAGCFLSVPPKTRSMLP